MKANKFWIAMDKHGRVLLFRSEPNHDLGFWMADDGDFDYGYYLYTVDSTPPPEISFSESPKQVELKLIYNAD